VENKNIRLLLGSRVPCRVPPLRDGPSVEAVPGVIRAVPGVRGAVPGVRGAVPGVRGAVPGVIRAVPSAAVPSAAVPSAAVPDERKSLRIKKHVRR